MRVVRAVKLGLLLACVSSIFGTGCASLSPKLRVLPSVARHRAESQYHAAWQAEQRGQLVKARELYATLQRNNSNVPQYAHRMGVVCTELQDYDTAGKYFEHARSLTPHDATLLADMGYCAYMQKDYKSAESLLSESVQIAPGDTRAVNNLAMSLGHQGKYDACLTQFRRGNSESQAQLNVAFIQNQRGDANAAMASYRRVLAQDPGNKIASASLQQLNTAQQQQQRPNVLEQVGDQFASLAGLPSPSDAPSWEAVAAPSMVAAVPPSPPAQTPVARDRVVAADTAPDVPIVIIPIDAQWSATPPPAPKQLDLVAADKSFELPSQAAQPKKLTEVAAQPAILQDPKPIAEAKAAIPDDVANVFELEKPLVEAPQAEANELADLAWTKEDLAREKAAIEADFKTSPHTGELLHGFCPVALRDERRLAAAHAEFAHDHQGQTYRFSSAAARDQFVAHPDWYVPAAGGLDVIEVQRGHSVAQGSLDHACWFRHKLHMFSTAENLAAFRATPRNFVIQ